MDNETAAVQQRLFAHQNPPECEAAQFALWWPADSGLGWTMVTAGGGRKREATAGQREEEKEEGWLGSTGVLYRS